MYGIFPYIYHRNQYISPMDASWVLELANSFTSATGAAAAEELSAELRRHGSKLLRVAQRLQKIRQEDPKAKAIVFVQWYELEHKVSWEVGREVVWWFGKISIIFYNYVGKFDG